MTLSHHPVTTALPFAVIMAEAVSQPFSWTQTLLVYGPLGLWVAWFIIRDRLDREERKHEKEDQERRHRENLAAMAEVRTALRVHMELTIVGMRAVQTMDKGYADLLEQFGKQNHEPK